MAGKNNDSRIKHEPHHQFKGYLVANNIRQKEIAELLSISRVTLSQKLNGYLHFNIGEVEKICRAYAIMPDIFFTKTLQNNNKRDG